MSNEIERDGEEFGPRFSSQESLRAMDQARPFAKHSAVVANVSIPAKELTLEEKVNVLAQIDREWAANRIARLSEKLGSDQHRAAKTLWYLMGGLQTIISTGQLTDKRLVECIENAVNFSAH
jgi:hypothetical protein